ncbi:MAG: hypothetical protein MZV70_40875 [Desulfobacterales bacterium]|nr:hypothetical protein [Desulfobacterales bacterium]
MTICAKDRPGPDGQHGRGLHPEQHQHPRCPGVHLAQPHGAGRLRGDAAAGPDFRGGEMAPGRGQPARPCWPARWTSPPP